MMYSSAILNQLHKVFEVLTYKTIEERKTLHFYEKKLKIGATHKQLCDMMKHMSKRSDAYVLLRIFLFIFFSAVADI